MSVLVTETDRFVHSCEFKLESSIDLQFQFPITEFTKHTIGHYKSFLYKREKGTFIYRILDAKLLANRYLVIFFQFTNKKSADPAFARIDNGQSRIVQKAPNEGGACTNHLVIDTQPIQGGHNTYNAILESMQGLSRTTICDILNALIRTIKYQDPDDKNVTHTPKVSLRFLAKMNFEQQLKEGKVKTIVAYKDSVKKSTMLDDDSMSIEYKQVSTLEFSKPSAMSMIFDSLARISKFSKEQGYNRIKITHEKNKITQSSDYYLDDIEDKNYQETADDIRLAPFTERYKIELNLPIKICDSKYHSELVNKMISHL